MNQQKLINALEDLISNICEDIPSDNMTRHLIESINEASELLGKPAPIECDDIEDWE